MFFPLTAAKFGGPFGALTGASHVIFFTQAVYRSQIISGYLSLRTSTTFLSGVLCGATSLTQLCDILSPPHLHAGTTTLSHLYTQFELSSRSACILRLENEARFPDLRNPKSTPKKSRYLWFHTELRSCTKTLLVPSLALAPPKLNNHLGLRPQKVR